MDYKEIIFICIAIAIIYAISRLFGRNKRYLIKNGIRGVGKVVNITQTVASVTSSTSPTKRIWEIDLEIEGAEAGAALVTVRHGYVIGSAVPQPGDRLSVLIDPKNPDNVILAG